MISEKLVFDDKNFISIYRCEYKNQYKNSYQLFDYWLNLIELNQIEFKIKKTFKKF